MAKDLENKTAIVTAASRGIGLAIAEKFVAEGAIVYMAVRDSEKNRQLTEQLHDQNENYRCVFYDAFDFTTYAPMIQQVVDEVGHLDILVNNLAQRTLAKIRRWWMATVRLFLISLIKISRVSITRLSMPSKQC